MSADERHGMNEENKRRKICINGNNEGGDTNEGGNSKDCNSRDSNSGDSNRISGKDCNNDVSNSKDCNNDVSNSKDCNTTIPNTTPNTSPTTTNPMPTNPTTSTNPIPNTTTNPIPNPMPINVYLRIKPSDTAQYAVSNGTLTYNNATYTFTKIFTKSSQSQLFDQIGKQTVINTIKGYNTTIFAYGQTGSGKTYTIKGDTHRPGLVPRILNYIFECNVADEVALSMLEIYNEKLRDLLCDEGVLCIREGLDGTYVGNLGKVVVRDYEMAMGEYERGSVRRRVGWMGMNRESSRSHCVLMVYFRGGEGVLVKESRINIVDLAGSERIRDGRFGGECKDDKGFSGGDKDGEWSRDKGSRGERFNDEGFNNERFNNERFNNDYNDREGNNYNYNNYNHNNPYKDEHHAREDHTNYAILNDRSAATIKETGNINKSLLSLREVIKKLGNNQNDHINYRDSKLTFLLKDSLGGNSNLTVIGTLNLTYKTESIHTLRFLQRAKHIKNTPTLSVGVKGDVEDIKRELTRVYARNKELEMRLREYEVGGTVRRVGGRYGDDIGWVRGEIVKVGGMVRGLIGDVERVVMGWFDRNRGVIGRMDEVLKRRGNLRDVVGDNNNDGSDDNDGKTNNRNDGNDTNGKTNDDDNNNNNINTTNDNINTTNDNINTTNDNINNVNKQNEKENVINNKIRVKNTNCDEAPVKNVNSNTTFN